jgi:hypothetical protein
MGGRLFALWDELDTAHDDPESNVELRLHEEEWSRVVDRGLGMITRRLPDPALVARSAPPS